MLEDVRVEVQKKIKPNLNQKGNGKAFDYVDDGKCDAFMMWTYDGTVYEYHLYHSRKGKQDNTDLSKIAGLYGGGGHRGASGFRSTKFLADPNIHIKV